MQSISEFRYIPLVLIVLYNDNNFEGNISESFSGKILCVTICGLGLICTARIIHVDMYNIL